MHFIFFLPSYCLICKENKNRRAIHLKSNIFDDIRRYYGLFCIAANVCFIHSSSF